MQPIHRAYLQVNTDLNALTEVLSWFDQFNDPPISYQTWLQCQLALAEGFTNAVRHAHQGQPVELPIDIEVVVWAEQLEMRIWDQGEPFNLLQKLDSLPQEMDSDAEGGRGLKLMQRIADSLSYIRTSDNRNCLLIIKHYSESQGLEVSV
ncbi:MAG: anti-sigma regulatory factor [Kovacikia sp.]